MLCLQTVVCFFSIFTIKLKIYVWYMNASFVSFYPTDYSFELNRKQQTDNACVFVIALGILQNH